MVIADRIRSPYIMPSFFSASESHLFPHSGVDTLTLHGDKMRRESPTALLVYSNPLFQSVISADE